MSSSSPGSSPAMRAAEELIARAGWERRWRRDPEGPGSSSLDLAALERDANTLDLSEESVVRIAISMATGHPVDLRSAFGHLTRDHAELVMIAVACAGGHDREEYRIIVAGQQRRVATVAPLGQWMPASVTGDAEESASSSGGEQETAQGSGT